MNLHLMLFIERDVALGADFGQNTALPYERAPTVPVLRPSHGTSILDLPTATRGLRGPGGRSIPTRSAAARGVCLSTSSVPVSV